jgi:hypothetical protein
MTIRNPKPISEALDPDARNALAALKRASQNARELAIRTNTPFVVVNSTKSDERTVTDTKYKGSEKK